MTKFKKVLTDEETVGISKYNVGDTVTHKGISKRVLHIAISPHSNAVYYRIGADILNSTTVAENELGVQGNQYIFEGKTVTAEGRILGEVSGKHVVIIKFEDGTEKGVYEDQLQEVK